MRQLPKTDGFSLSCCFSVQKFISEDRLPHLLLYGPPGTGKTSTILACAKQLYRDKEFGSMVLEVSRIILTLQMTKDSSLLTLVLLILVYFESKLPTGSWERSGSGIRYFTSLFSVVVCIGIGQLKGSCLGVFLSCCQL